MSAFLSSSPIHQRNIFLILHRNIAHSIPAYRLDRPVCLGRCCYLCVLQAAPSPATYYIPYHQLVGWWREGEKNRSFPTLHNSRPPSFVGGWLFLPPIRPLHKGAQSLRLSNKMEYWHYALLLGRKFQLDADNCEKFSKFSLRIRNWFSLYCQLIPF